jgi:hypothetical protein
MRYTSKFTSNVKTFIIGLFFIICSKIDNVVTIVSSYLVIISVLIGLLLYILNSKFNEKGEIEQKNQSIQFGVIVLLQILILTGIVLVTWFYLYHYKDVFLRFFKS